MADVCRCIHISLALLLCSLSLSPGEVLAHRLTPAVATVTFEPGGEVNITVAANFEALMAGVSPSHKDTEESPQAATYSSLRALPSADFSAQLTRYIPQYIEGLHAAFDGVRAPLRLVSADVKSVDDSRKTRTSTVHFRATAPSNAQQFTWAYAERFGTSVLRIHAGTAAPVTKLLRPGNRSDAYPLAEPYRGPGAWQVMLDYTAHGFIHIVPEGLDHILFVIGIVLLSIRVGPLLWQVTAFTLAHSITLSLALFGIVELPSSIVEPLIAASIIYVGVENLMTARLKPWRVAIVFGFGLLHGMGFAGVLRDIGLPPDQLIPALIAFNVGVEGGQLTVVAGTLLAGCFWFSGKVWYRKRLVMPASTMIALIGAYWLIERIIG
jgi:hydrogenase/urease accessory protein HupE